MGDPSGPILIPGAAAADAAATAVVAATEEEHARPGTTGGADMMVLTDEPLSLIGMGPPSPLTGCYLLIILGEPHSQEHKDIILQRLIKGK